MDFPRGPRTSAGESPLGDLWGNPQGSRGCPRGSLPWRPRGSPRGFLRGSPHGRAEICIHDFWRLVKGWFRGSIVGVVEGLVGGRGGRDRRRVPVVGVLLGESLGFFLGHPCADVIVGTGMSFWWLVLVGYPQDDPPRRPPPDSRNGSHGGDHREPHAPPWKIPGDPRGYPPRDPPGAPLGDPPWIALVAVGRRSCTIWVFGGCRCHRTARFSLSIPLEETWRGTGASRARGRRARINPASIQDRSSVRPEAVQNH